MPTIVAPATPPGNGGIGILRLSGPGAKSLLARVFLPHSPKFKNFRPWVLHRGVLLDAHETPLDDVLAVFMPGPRTYTGEDTAEVHCHGGHLVIQQGLESFLRLGARLADPGEFTRRAYLNGRLDLTQAEAVAEIISAPSREALTYGLGRLEGRLAQHVARLTLQINELRALARIGVDFPDDEVDGLDVGAFSHKVKSILAEIAELLQGSKRALIMSQGVSIALAGYPNVGKSSLLNQITGLDRALVTPFPGTTRDFIEMGLNLDGLPIRLIDTAGLRSATDDPVERLGIDTSHRIIEAADLVLLVLDVTRLDDIEALDLVRHISPSCILVFNKIDLRPDFSLPDWAENYPYCTVSAVTGQNMDKLSSAIKDVLLGSSRGALMEEFVPPNGRQTESLKKASEELQSLLNIMQELPYECWLSHLDLAAHFLDNVVSLAKDDELLDMIFSQFCIGK